jgi:BirA family transcriptional regulator, biotin operon repressor / biotin---[acetyl-CoA-carboxylase] ligase
VSRPLFASAAEAAAWALTLPAGTPGHGSLAYRESTASTQDLAFAAGAKGAPGGAVFLADEQSAGRGRQGRNWQASPGSSLLFSILVSAVPDRDSPGRLSLGGALAVCRAVENMCEKSPVIKWPNDLLLAGRKFAGLLIEVRGDRAVLGVGINVLQTAAEFSGDLAERATSLAISCGGSVDRQELLAAVLIEFGKVMLEIESDWAKVHQQVTQRLAWCGSSVRVGEVRGVLRGLSAEGRLLIVDETGEVHEVSSGSLEGVRE